MSKWIKGLAQFILENRRVYKDKDGKEIPYQEVLKQFDYLKKEQKYIPLFFDIHTEEGKSHQELKDIYKQMTDHKNTIKQNNIDITKAVKFEDIIDILADVDLIEKTNKFIKKIPNPLRQRIKSNEEHSRRFREAIIDYDYDDYNKVFLKKIAKYKDRPVEDFFDYLSAHLKNFGSIKETFLKVKNDPDAEIVYFDEDESLVVMVYSKDGSCNLGSQQWCISNPSWNYWSNYITKSGKPGVQYFVWDLTKEGVRSQVGITLYGKGDYTAHYKDDSRASGLEQEDFFQHLKTWDELEERQKIKYLAENENMGQFVGDTFKNFSDEEKKKYLMQYPNLIRLFDDVKFLTEEEITDMIKKDVRVTKYESVAKSLNIDQKKYSIVKNPNLLESDVKDYYKEATPLLTTEERLEMISNKHSLYEKIELTDKELYRLIEIDPTILVSFTKIVSNTADNAILKKMYLENKEDWDRKINSVDNENKTKVSLLLSQLIKDDDRLKKESENFYFYFLGKEEEKDGTTYVVPKKDHDLIMVEDHLNPVNLDLTMLMFSREKDDKLYFTMLPKEMFTEAKYEFNLDLEAYLNGDGSETDRDIMSKVQEYNKASA